MSRVHDALRKAAQQYEPSIPAQNPRVLAGQDAVADSVGTTTEPDDSGDLRDIIRNAHVIPYHPLADALVVNPAKPREAPGEEFRTLRTRLNHLQTLQPLHTLVVTSASPAEGKSFTATNLALTQAQLTDKRVLLADFDFRRPTVDKTFQVDISPGLTDYLLGQVPLSSIVRKLDQTNLYVLTAGQAVPNPLELLNLKECKSLIEDLRQNFDWVILDSPPLLFAADGNLLSTMCDGTILVVRIGTTTFDSVTRALQSLCENNVLGIVVNGARRGELYSKYTYYHDYYAPGSKEEEEAQAAAQVDA
ncbi:MAG TPA: CpsD/CapB family tyrosine-protein kinase [Bryobacteraceae bacterium]|jgi:receptor protein-tyrosine kinase|nr:CpsD/CapB family tyrosine-protein kinase [Bryobacteraceae bacterium]